MLSSSCYLQGSKSLPGTTESTHQYHYLDCIIICAKKNNNNNNNILRVLYFLTETTFPIKYPSWLWENVPKKSQNRCSTLILYYSLLTLKWRICLEGQNETRNPRTKGREICSKLTEHSDGCQLEVETLHYLQQFSTPHPTPPPNNTCGYGHKQRNIAIWFDQPQSKTISKNRIALTPQI